MNELDAPETSDKQRESGPAADLRDDAARETARPFDSSALRRIPAPTDDDPPYRNWWATDER